MLTILLTLLFGIILGLLLATISSFTSSKSNVPNVNNSNHLKKSFTFTEKPEPLPVKLVSPANNLNRKSTIEL